MGNQKMGFEGILYIGTAGTTGSNQVTNATDLDFNFSPDKGPTTVRGTSSAPPVKTESVTAIGVQIEWTMVYDTTDTNLTAMMTAAAGGSAIAVRMKDYASGKGPDCDCTLAVENGMPLGGEQTKKFTATPTRDAGRTPQLYV